MDPASFILSTPGKSQGYPTYSILSNARDFNIFGSVFNDIVEISINITQTRKGQVTVVVYSPSLA